MPAHLWEPIQRWLDKVFGRQGGGTVFSGTGTATMFDVALACRIHLPLGCRDSELYHAIGRFCWEEEDQENLLDVIHNTIQLARPPIESLDRMLAVAAPHGRLLTQACSGELTPPPEWPSMPPRNRLTSQARS